jgi:hypothetical protein
VVVSKNPAALGLLIKRGAWVTLLTADAQEATPKSLANAMLTNGELGDDVHHPQPLSHPWQAVRAN